MSWRLRPATWQDAYALWIWANDPETRAGSGHRLEIGWADHVRWLEARVAVPDALVLVAEAAEGQPVGTIRFETGDGWSRARLSYVVAPEARGGGWGRRLLEAGVTECRRRHPQTAIEAEVWPNNARSLHLFRDLGWPEQPSDRGTWLFGAGREGA